MFLNRSGRLAHRSITLSDRSPLFGLRDGMYMVTNTSAKPRTATDREAQKRLELFEEPIGSKSSKHCLGPTVT